MKDVVTHALLAAGARLVPAPGVDTWLGRKVMRRAVRKLADARGVTIDDEAVAALSDGLEGARAKGRWTGSIARRLLARASRHVLLAFGLVGHARAAIKTVATLTLLDDYFERVHDGGALSSDDARAIAEVVKAALITGKPLRRPMGV